MIAAWILWCAVLAGVAVVWSLRHRELSRARRESQPLTERSYPGPATDAPPLSVLIAAKDEAENIERCVRTMMRQDYPDYELIVVNDRSTDGTGEILDRLAGEYDGRLRAVHVTDLPTGWFGKNHAMHTGVQHARGQWLCFSDADCTQHSTATLSTAVQEALRYHADLLSILPQLETDSTWEQIIQPVCGGVMMIWFSPRRVNDPGKRTAYANGAFMLMRRRTYETLGGHGAVRDQLNEDMHMARRCKEHGLNLRVVRNEGLYSVRMYTTLRQIWRGWSRIFYGCFGTWRQLTLSLLVMLIMGLLPWASAAIGWIGVAADWQASSWWWSVALLASAALLAQQTVIARYRRLTGTHPALAVTYPLAGVIVSGMLLNAMAKRAGATTDWRGTVYRRGQVEAGAGTAEHD